MHVIQLTFSAVNAEIKILIRNYKSQPIMQQVLSLYHAVLVSGRLSGVNNVIK